MSEYDISMQVARERNECQDELSRLKAKVYVIEALCLKHATPASNAGAHKLAREILEVIREG